MAFLFIISLVLLTAYIVLIGYYHYRFHTTRYIQLNPSSPCTKLAVIMPARNEECNIERCVHSILEQNYPTHLFEIIVVDDCSTDETAKRVSDIISKNKDTYAIQLLQLNQFINENETNSFKKKGIELAIQKTDAELIITTDADCKMPTHWLSTIASFYQSSKAQLIAMPVRLVTSHQQNVNSTSFVQAFQILDFTTLQGITAASVDNQLHTMCNGANLAYTKKAFEKVGGFQGIDALASGDDMLLMYKIQQQFPKQIRYLKSKQVIVDSLTVNTWKAFLNQRIRWASKAAYYDDQKMFYVLVLVYLVNVVCLGMLLSLVIVPGNWLWVLLFFAIKFIVEIRFVKDVLSFFNQKKLIKWFPLSFSVHIFYTILAGFLGKFGKYNWKDRIVK